MLRSLVGSEMCIRDRDEGDIHDQEQRPRRRFSTPLWPNHDRSAGLRIQHVRADKGTACTSSAFQEFRNDSGIALEFAATATAQQVGVSERDGRTIATIARCLLKDGNFPQTCGAKRFLKQFIFPTGRCTLHYTAQHRISTVSYTHLTLPTIYSV